MGLRVGRESAGGSWFRPTTRVRQGRLLARTGPRRGVGGVAVRERERGCVSFRGARGQPGGDDWESPLRRACDGRQARLRGGGELEDPGRELPRVLPLLLHTSRALQGEPAQERRGPRGSGGLDRRLNGARGPRRDHVANRRELRPEATAPDSAPGAGSVLLQLFPNLLMSLHPDYVMTHRLRPLAPDRTAVECEWLFSKEAVESEGFDPSY